MIKCNVLKYTKYKEGEKYIIDNISMEYIDKPDYIYYNDNRNLGLYCGDFMINVDEYLSVMSKTIYSDDVQYCLDYLKIESRSTKLDYLKKKKSIQVI